MFPNLSVITLQKYDCIGNKSGRSASLPVVQLFHPLKHLKLYQTKSSLKGAAESNQHRNIWPQTAAAGLLVVMKNKRYKVNVTYHLIHFAFCSGKEVELEPRAEPEEPQEPGLLWVQWERRWDPEEVMKQCQQKSSQEEWSLSSCAEEDLQERWCRRFNHFIRRSCL